MYIEYITPQRIADPNITEYISNEGQFRPTWLIRTCDWQKVTGDEATKGYHALSYCWEQSGEMFLKEDGEYGLIDRKYHRVVTKVLEKRKTRRSTRYRWRTNSLQVSYDDLLQQICSDHHIDYLWYDKICIDQTNKEETYREIKQMHLIYSNARYTVAVVPEITINDPKEFESLNVHLGYAKAKATAVGMMLKSLWWRRSWTLEELMMSTRVLIVGRNTHFWSLATIEQGKTRKENDILARHVLGFKKKELKSVNQVLTRAHSRTSSKEHDRIFALANIFHGVVSIDIDYSSDVLAVVRKVYRQLAERDLSVMCFGSNSYPNGQPIYATTMASYNLPSWTGVAGIHSLTPVSNTVTDRNNDYIIDSNMNLHITCRSYTIQPRKYDNHDIFFNTYDSQRAQAANSNYSKVITSMDDFGGDEEAALDWSQYCMARATDCYATHYWKPDSDHTAFCSPVLPLSLTEESEECTILGVVFNSKIERAIGCTFIGHDSEYLSPIVKKLPDATFKVIGVILLKHLQFDESHSMISPENFLNNMFSQLSCEYHDFCIK